MSDDRVSYMYQREPSVDRRYRPRPINQRALYKEIAEEEEKENVTSSISSLSNVSQNSSNTVDTSASVLLRLKPMKKSCKHYETENNFLKVIPIENATTNNKDLTEKHFEFSKIFHNKATQLDVYKQSVHASVQNDENLTVLTYGTSGSGKTYTMFGKDSEAGLVQRCITHIFTIYDKIICETPYVKQEKGNITVISPHNIHAESKLTKEFISDDFSVKNQQLIQQICDEHDFEQTASEWEFAFIWISFAEIYNENVYDLLKPNNGTTKRKNLKIISNDGNSYIKDLTSVHVRSASEAFNVINTGLQQVNYASTNVNANSSRSHCILVVKVIHFSFPDLYSVATYKFCDLAGSERLKKTENVGDRLKEAQRINTSLMVLGRCFDLMFQNQQSKSKEVQVPFRESKLTMLLQKALLGHEKITTIVTMAPELDFMEENLQVLNFASIAQQIVYKQPKPMEKSQRRAKSARLSSFMGIAQRNEKDWNVIIAENERLETENCDLREERDKLLESMQQLIAEHSKQEQQLRTQLVEQRESQMKKAQEKHSKRLQFEAEKSARREGELIKVIEKLRKDLEKAKDQLRQTLTIDIDDDESENDDEKASNGSYGTNSANSSVDREASDCRNVDGESFEKKRCLNSSYE